jgi:hypothetical protein
MTTIVFVSLMQITPVWVTPRPRSRRGGHFISLPVLLRKGKSGFRYNAGHELRFKVCSSMNCEPLNRSLKGLGTLAETPAPLIGNRYLYRSLNGTRYRRMTFRVVVRAQVQLYRAWVPWYPLDPPASACADWDGHIWD